MRTRIYYSKEQRDLIWDRWKPECIKQVCADLGGTVF